MCAGQSIEDRWREKAARLADHAQQDMLVTTLRPTPCAPADLAVAGDLAFIVSSACGSMAPVAQRYTMASRFNNSRTGKAMISAIGMVRYCPDADLLVCPARLHVLKCQGGSITNTS